MGTLIGIGNTVPQFPYKDLWYGIRINLKNGGHCVADGKLERVGNLDLHRSLPIQKRIRRYMAKADGSVNYSTAHSKRAAVLLALMPLTVLCSSTSPITIAALSLMAITCLSL